MINSIHTKEITLPVLPSEDKKENIIVYLNSGPRCLSTVALRIAENLGFSILHEPTIPVYDKKHYSELTKDWFKEDAFETFEDVKKAIYGEATKRNVFIKDMSFSSRDSILNDESFMRDKAIHFLFLVRNPHHSSISFYKKNGGIVPGTSDLIGLKKLYEEYEEIKKVNENGVKIIFSEQLYNNPKKVVHALCEHLEIPYTDKALEWEALDSNFNGHHRWREQKVGDFIHHWHGRAITSKTIGKPSSYKEDALGKPTFEEISILEDREIMKEAYLENNVFYEKFLDAKEDHLV